MMTGTRLFAVIAIASFGVGPAPASAQSSPGDFDAVSFMVGCWAQRPDSSTGLREIYPPPAANMMTGLSQFWREGAIVDFEFHTIQASPEGPVLTPHPRGVASVTFSPVDVGSDRIVWENLAHDFPQRIIYARIAVDSLVVRIEGGEGAEARSAEWRMARARCPASDARD